MPLKKSFLSSYISMSPPIGGPQEPAFKEYEDAEVCIAHIKWLLDEQHKNTQKEFCDAKKWYRERIELIQKMADDAEVAMVDLTQTCKKLGSGILISANNAAFTFADGSLLPNPQDHPGPNLNDHDATPAIELLQSQNQMLITELEKTKAVVEVLEARLNAESERCACDTKKTQQTKESFIETEGNIRVYCRVNAHDREGKWNDSGVCDFSILNGCKELNIPKVGGEQKYQFSYVFGPNASNDEVFEEIKPILSSAVNGHDMCIFAYGRTGSGKSHTLKGLIPRAVREILKCSELHVQCFEVYNSRVYDRSQDAKPTFDSTKVFWDTQSGHKILKNIRLTKIAEQKDFNKFWKAASQSAHKAATRGNATSSRGHLILFLHIATHGEDGTTCYSTLTVADLAGREDIMSNNDKAQQDEARAIINDLNRLVDLIRNLKATPKTNSSSPYKASALNRVLENSLKRHTKILLIATVSAAEEDREREVLTLDWARECGGISMGEPTK